MVCNSTDAIQGFDVPCCSKIHQVDGLEKSVCSGDGDQVFVAQGSVPGAGTASDAQWLQIPIC